MTAQADWRSGLLQTRIQVGLHLLSRDTPGALLRAHLSDIFIRVSSVQLDFINSKLSVMKRDHSPNPIAGVLNSFWTFWCNQRNFFIFLISSVPPNPSLFWVNIKQNKKGINYKKRKRKTERELVRCFAFLTYD